MRPFSGRMVAERRSEGCRPRAERRHSSRNLRLSV